MGYDRDTLNSIYKRLIEEYNGHKNQLVADYRNTENIPNYINKIINMGYSRYGFSDADKRGIIDNIMHWVADISDAAPAQLSSVQKIQLQRFYSTNAGASFINTWSRNSYLKPEARIPEAYSQIERALGAAAKEKVSQGNVAFSAEAHKAIRTAFRHGNPEKVMTAALSDYEEYYRAPQYRGTRVPRERLAQFKVGDVMENTFFTSFSPDIYTPKSRGDDVKTHDGLKEARRFMGDAYKSHVGARVIYEMPRSKARQISTLYEYETVVPPGEKFEILSIENKGDYEHIRLKRVEKAIKSKRLMLY